MIFKCKKINKLLKNLTFWPKWADPKTVKLLKFGSIVHKLLNFEKCCFCPYGRKNTAKKWHKRHFSNFNNSILELLN